MKKEENGVDCRMRDFMNGAAADSEMTEAGGSEPDNVLQLLSATETRAVREWISMAHQLINQGKPSEALQAVMMATRTQGGDAAVIEFLRRARELYRRTIQERTAADQLASLFAECAIAEAEPLRPESSSVTMETNSTNMTLETQGSSILAENGRTQVVLDASADGSSFICLQCGGLVNIQRKDEHYAYWCSSLQSVAKKNYAN